MKHLVYRAAFALGAIALAGGAWLGLLGAPSIAESSEQAISRLFTTEQFLGFMNAYALGLVAAGLLELALGLWLRRGVVKNRKLPDIIGRRGWLLTILALLLPLLGASLSQTSVLYVQNEIVFYAYALPGLICVSALILLAAPKIVRGNFAVLLVLVVVVELIFSFLPPRDGKPPSRQETEVEGGGRLVENSTVTGYIPRPNGKARVRRFIGEQQIFDATYNFDEHSRRVVPVTGEGRDRFLIFFGGSRTLGTGTNDDQTIPFHAGSTLTDHRPYSYSFSGWGPSQFLATLQSRDLSAEIPEPRGTAVLLLITSHLRRVSGSFRISTRYNSGYIPYYRNDESGAVTREGMFVTGRPWLQLLYSVLSQSSTFTYFIKDFAIADEEYVLTADVLAEIKRSLEERFEVERFVVFYHPWNSELERMSPLLDERDIEHVSLIDLFEQTDEQYIHHRHDTHLSPAGNARVAEAMAEHLRAPATR